MRLDGFVSMEGYEPEGTLTPRRFLLEGDRLIVNARAPEKPWGARSVLDTPYGRLRVELLDAGMRVVSGYTAADCDPFTGDDVRHVVTWNDDPDLASVAGTPVRLRFHLNNAALYSFRIGGDSAPGPFDLNLHAPGNRGRP
jgi:hypothetical protein